MWQFWLILAGIFLIIEILNSGFLIFWFSMGSLVAMLSSFFIDNVIIQAAIFLVVSTILLFATKPFVRKIMKSGPDYKTAADSIIGKKALVTIDINPMEETGQVKVNSELWTAVTTSNEVIPKGEEVIIEKIDGVKAVVKK